MKQYKVKNIQQSFVVENLPKIGFELSVSATPDECIILAEKMDAVSVDKFNANIIIKQWRKGGAHITGEYEVTLTQECVISLEPFVTELSKTIDQKFFGSTKIPELNDSKEVEMLDNDLDPPEALVDGSLDITNYLVETALLHLDPYPRKPGVSLNDLTVKGDFQINQPTVEDVHNDADNVEDGKSAEKKVATHNPFANLDKLLKDK